MEVQGDRAGVRRRARPARPLLRSQRLSAAARPAPSGLGDRRTIEFPTGILRIEAEPGAWTLDQLCGFAARHNPRRGFLVVSRVLGRHLPARPDATRQSARDLAGLVPPGLPGPVLVFGLAETAICLGQTVHAELRAATGRDDVWFLHSTRQRIGAPLLCRFEEPHSHAPDQLVYRPQLPDFAPPRSLLLVDDEVSTGQTLVNLAAALVEAWPGVEAIVSASLTDWSDGAWLDRMPRPAMRTALLNGRLDWAPHPGVPPDRGRGSGAPTLGRLDRHDHGGRVGLHRPSPPPTVAHPPIAGPVRVIGTGEFTFPPFQLAEALQRAGHDVVVQATSRSPARIGGMIGTALSFRDHEGAGVPNYLYNADPADGRANWICHETPDGSVDPLLIEALGAKLVRWPG